MTVPLGIVSVVNVLNDCELYTNLSCEWIEEISPKRWSFLQVRGQGLGSEQGRLEHWFVLAAPNKYHIWGHGEAPWCLICCPPNFSVSWCLKSRLLFRSLPPSLWGGCDITIRHHQSLALEASSRWAKSTATILVPELLSGLCTKAQKIFVVIVSVRQ